MDRIAKTSGPSKIFETLKDCLVFCAALGAAKEKREPFSDPAEPIALHLFNGEFDKEFINALAIFDTKDAKIIFPEREDERIKIFEEYACGGLHILHAEIGGYDLDEEKQLVSMLAKQMDRSGLLDDITSL